MSMPIATFAVGAPLERGPAFNRRLLEHDRSLQA